MRQLPVTVRVTIPLFEGKHHDWLSFFRTSNFAIGAKP